MFSIICFIFYPQYFCSIVQQELVQKGKENIGVEGKGTRPTRGFKAKKKVSFKPKGVLGPGVGQDSSPGCAGSKGVRPSSFSFPLLEKSKGTNALRSCLAGASSSAGGAPTADLGNSAWVREGWPI